MASIQTSSNAPAAVPQVNEDLDHRTLLRKYERELRRLRAELQQKSKDLVDKRLVLQVRWLLLLQVWRPGLICRMRCGTGQQLPRNTHHPSARRHRQQQGSLPPVPLTD